MKRLIKHSDTLQTLPQIGEISTLEDDPQYLGVSNYVVTNENFRDAPVVVYKDKVYYGKAGQTHYQLMDEIGIRNEVKEIGYGYFLKSYLGQPAVFLDNFSGRNIEELTNIIKTDKNEVNVFIINKEDKFTRLAKNKKDSDF